MNALRYCLLLAFGIGAQASPPAYSATAGSSSGSSSVSVTVSGTNGLVGGTYSSEMTDTEASDTSSTSASDEIIGSGNDGTPIGYVSLSADSSSNVATSGSTLSLSGSGALTLSEGAYYVGYQSGGGGYQSVTGGAAGATSLQQTFLLSPGEDVDYVFNLTVSGDTLPYTPFWFTNLGATLSPTSGPATALVSGGLPFTVSPATPYQEPEVTGRLENTTDANLVYTIGVTLMSDTLGFNTAGGVGSQPTYFDSLSYNYNFSVTPAPEINAGSAGSALTLLVGGIAVLRGRRGSIALDLV